MANVKLSPHFSMSEFFCHCGGKLKGCKHVIVNMQLVGALEKLRNAHYRNGGLVIRAGYRCPVHNAQVHGVRNSQHILGTAADIQPRATWEEVKALRLFTGFGYNTENGLVVHVDVRRPGSVEHPTIWTYTGGETDSPNKHHN